MNIMRGKVKVKELWFGKEGRKEGRKEKTDEGDDELVNVSGF